MTKLYSPSKFAHIMKTYHGHCEVQDCDEVTLLQEKYRQAWQLLKRVREAAAGADARAWDAIVTDTVLTDVRNFLDARAA